MDWAKLFQIHQHIEQISLVLHVPKTNSSLSVELTLSRTDTDPQRVSSQISISPQRGADTGDCPSLTADLVDTTKLAEVLQEATFLAWEIECAFKKSLVPPSPPKRRRNKIESEVEP
jgi:hypothetical protein